LGKETKIIGASDHRIVELPLLFEFARQGRLDLAQIVTRRIPLDAAAINKALDNLRRYGAGVRTVVVP
jgi:Zn-dependent alcohol dehydrogenase